MQKFRIALFVIGVGVGLPLMIWDPWATDPPVRQPESPPVTPEAQLDPSLPEDVAVALRAAQADYDAKRRRKALDRIIHYAEAGYHDVDTLLGRLYLSGGDGIEDPEKALFHLTRAVAQDNPIAWYMLGARLFVGDPVLRDTKRGFALLRKAADCGMPAAHSVLGAYYAEGYGLDQNIEKAEAHRNFAAWAGVPEAQFNLGNIYINREKPRIGKKGDDLVIGLQWNLLAARQGLSLARENLRKLWTKIKNEYDTETLEQVKNVVIIRADHREARILPADPLVCGFEHFVISKIP